MAGKSVIRKKALVVLSGGIDSSVVLWWARSRGWNLATLSFYFKGRRKKEIEATQKLRKLIGCKENFDLNLSFLDSPKSEESCYIPKRNLMYYGIAASLAEKIQAKCILGGHCKHDGKVFFDARENYFQSLNHLIQSGSKNKRGPSLLFPLIRSSKDEIIKLGEKLKVPFQVTWSCSLDGAAHCWNCKSCKEREDGFKLAGVKDPLYAIKK
ncbi:MAG: hypothetical protein A3I11_03560 [Elusimicrobia bacterium RIFCSPLOWO2_02_FULL_39_32]|nr:MAG: hypothetical protein A2034_00260 [Elusimicrobia bacterium GWA2_38_7]OGR79458.1 MAG: hypothetical protein A3B80_02130 [Elusimicrobia bacterium RIFCSPHIGHO2_02_FULL_39_36]OGR92785.1 MAG: hypothetical protein A3I11_03560 [Elusimicrobia bacterium RIFCSPLOWO2_02_FULL_39_32]OGR99570.1 MAG: hypothetical protein A3G85_00915 [Elusimicrobia bacterium RIFCSPLOWO2_12_FULL_39_28]